MLATKFRFTPKHILYGKLRPYLNKVALPNFHGVCTTEILPVLPDERKVDRRYLYALLLSPNFVKWASANVSGANLPRITPERLAEYRLALPPLDEQKYIAALLDKADHLRRTRRYVQELSDSFLQSVFLKMFGDLATNPMGWEAETLDDRVTYLTSGSRGWARYYAPQGDMFLRIQNVGHNRLLLSDLAYVNPPQTAEGRRTRVKSGDMLLSITADLGRTAVIPEGFPTAYINQHLALLRMRDINPVFASACLASPGGQNQIQSLDREGVKSGLNFDDVRSLKIVVPPRYLQDKYAEVVRQYDRLYSQQVEADRLAEHLFQTLLYRAFAN